MADSFVFMFPDGRSAEVGRGPAGLISHQLWNLGLVAGAATAAARISQALQSRAVFGTEVRFGEREVAVTLEAAKTYPPTWMRLAEEQTIAGLALDERRQLITTCVALINGLDTDNQHQTIGALTRDLQHVRDQLLRMTAHELLHRAANRVSSGWSQGAEARTADGRPVPVTDRNATLFSLLGALQASSLAGGDMQPDEIRLAVAAIAQLISDPSLAHWNDQKKRTQREVQTLLEQASTLVESTGQTST